MAEYMTSSCTSGGDDWPRYSKSGGYSRSGGWGEYEDWRDHYNKYYDRDEYD